MEEFLVALISAIAEIAVEVLVSLPWDILLAIFERRRSAPGKPAGWPPFALFLCGASLGLALGALSLQVRRDTLLPYPWLRIANLVVAPTISGVLAHGAARRRNATGKRSSPRLHFTFASALTLALVLVRFVHAIRPGN